MDPLIGAAIVFALIANGAMIGDQTHAISVGEDEPTFDARLALVCDVLALVCVFVAIAKHLVG